MNPLALISLIALGLLLLMAGLVRLRRSRRIGPELSRKIMHVALGLACLGLPWWVGSAWPVLLLCALVIGVLLWVRFRNRREGGLASSLHDVGRASLGDVCFPLAVGVLFVLQREPVTDYLIPLLILTVADAVGALVGLRYGTARFTTGEGFKSVEGSVAFFFAAFLSTHVPLLLFTDIGRPESLLIATLIGLLIMLVEAISWRGLDNLFIPLGAFVLLNVYLSESPSELLLRIAVLASVGVIFLLLSRRSFARGDTLLAAMLILYLIWALGGWGWIFAPLSFALGYAVLCPKSGPEFQNRHGLADVGSVSGGGVFWLFLAVGGEWPELIVAFTFSWAAQLAMVFAAFVAWQRPGTPQVVVVLAAGLFALLLFAPALWLSPARVVWLPAVPLLFAMASIAALCLWKLEWKARSTTLAPLRPWRQFAYGMACSSTGVLFLLS